MLSASVGADRFVWLIGSLCQLSRIPFDAQLILEYLLSPVQKAWHEAGRER